MAFGAPYKHIKKTVRTSSWLELSWLHWNEQIYIEVSFAFPGIRRNHNVAARQGSQSFHVLSVSLTSGYQKIEANRENNFLLFRRVHAWLLSSDSLPFNTFQCAFAHQFFQGSENFSQEIHWIKAEETTQKTTKTNIRIESKSSPLCTIRRDFTQLSRITLPRCFLCVVLQTGRKCTPGILEKRQI